MPTPSTGDSTPVTLRLGRRVADVHHRHAEAGRSVAITTSSVATAREINLAIQAKRRERDGQRVALGDGTTVAGGDLIATRRNDAALNTDREEPVRNRQVRTAQGVRAKGDLAGTNHARGPA